MTATASRTHARAAVARVAFDDYLRIGCVRTETAALLTTATGDLFVKYNHNHDPAKASLPSLVKERRMAATRCRANNRVNAAVTRVLRHIAAPLLKARN